MKEASVKLASLLYYACGERLLTPWSRNFISFDDDHASLARGWRLFGRCLSWGIIRDFDWGCGGKRKREH